jgi:menaquinone-dependent protoporphyrinogen oxidase
VAGALPYTRYNFLIRFMMRRIVKTEGGDTDTSRDYEYTDWAAVDRFAAEFVDEVTASRPIGVPLPRPGMSAPAAHA